MTRNLLKVGGPRSKDHREFRSQAAASDYAAALTTLKKAGIYGAVASCFDLARSDLAAFNGLAAHATNGGGDAWSRYCLLLAKNGNLPTSVSRMTRQFLDSARQIVLLARTHEQTLTKRIGWKSSRATAPSVPFYPEYLHLSRRDRICKIASDHAKLGPKNLRQVNLFSLGGLYKWPWAEGGTSPKKGGTTCFLFIRSVLHAAGCNVIGPKTRKVICNCPGGFSELPGGQRNFGWTESGKSRPKPGDVFLIRGGSVRK